MTRKEKRIILIKAVATCLFLFYSSLDILCIRDQSSGQTIALNALEMGSQASFALYWLLWAWWDDERLHDLKVHWIFYFAVGLSLARFIYLPFLCP